MFVTFDMYFYGMSKDYYDYNKYYNYYSPSMQSPLSSSVVVSEEN